MYCAKCGKEIPNDADFCTACGRPVAKDINYSTNSKEDIFSRIKGFVSDHSKVLKITIRIILIVLIVILVKECISSNSDADGVPQKANNENAQAGRNEDKYVQEGETSGKTNDRREDKESINYDTVNRETENDINTTTTEDSQQYSIQFPEFPIRFDNCGIKNYYVQIDTFEYTIEETSDDTLKIDYKVSGSSDIATAYVNYACYDSEGYEIETGSIMLTEKTKGDYKKKGQLYINSQTTRFEILKPLN